MPVPLQPPAVSTTSELVGAHISSSVSDVIGTTMLSCTMQSWPGLDRIVVLRVLGEIDLLTYPILHTALNVALSGAVDEPTSCLVVDLTGVTFCSMHGFALLAQMALVADANETGYALSGCSTHLERCWRILDTTYPDPDHRATTRYVSTASAVIATHADRRTHHR